MAMFAALAFVLSLATAGIRVAFLTIDIKDAILAIGAFIYGPLASLPLCIVTAFLSSVITGFETGFWGLAMDFLSSFIFVITAATVYKYKRTMTGAVIGLFAAVLVYTVMMVPLNLLITPIYTKQPVEAVAGLLTPLLLPFNFAKSISPLPRFTVYMPQPISTPTIFGTTLSVTVIVVPIVQPLPA